MDNINTNKSVQCNTYLQNLPQRKNKGVECKLKVPTRVATTQTKQDNSSKPASTSVLCKLSAKITKQAQVSTENKEVQFNTDIETKSTQTEGRFIGPIISRIEHIVRNETSYSHIDIQVKEWTGMTLSRKNGWNVIGKMVDPVLININQVGDCSVNVIFQKSENNQIVFNNEVNIEKLQKLLELLHPDYRFCHGINQESHCQNVSSIVKFNHPYSRLQSTKCPVWWRPQNPSQKHLYKQCIYCRHQTQYLLKRKQRKEATTSAAKRARINHSVLEFTQSTENDNGAHDKSTI